MDGPDSELEEVGVPITMWPAQKVGKKARTILSFDKKEDNEA